MGLDINAYSQLKKVDSVFDSYGKPINPVTRQSLGSNYVQFWVNFEFPGRNNDIEDRAVYAFKGKYRFRAGSYGSYNQWRATLASMAGYKPVEAWDGQCEEKAFVELVNFSDCEGVIGAKTSKKLAQDFAAHDDQAKLENEYFYQTYCNFRKAFDMAANGGAVKFC